tara:strand:- start:150 stop:710 length:561 start_codon:yes stop_codon:yes gene_type:complete
LGNNVRAFEEPQYEVVALSDGYEVRYYQDRLAAEASGALSANGAFRRLFKYNSGANTTSSKVEMTVPVTQFVTNNTTFPISTSSERHMQFYLPSKLTYDTAPIPIDPEITIITIEGGYYAVSEYTGRSTNNKFDRQQRLLVAALERDNVIQISTPIKATYNGPLTLPFKRRNEVMFRIKWQGRISN